VLAASSVCDGPVSSSETSVYLYWTIRRHIPEDSTLYCRRCEDLKPKPSLMLAEKMEAVCSSETSVDLYWTIRRHIPEDSIL
jgi:hypothetical protein